MQSSQRGSTEQLELNSSRQSPKLGDSSKSPINVLYYQFFSSHPCSWHVSITKTHKKMVFDPDFKELDPKCMSQSIHSPISVPEVQKVPPLEQRSCMVALLPRHFSKAATEKTKSKNISPYHHFKARWFGVKMQQTDYSHMPQLLQRPMETRVALKCRDMRKNLNPRGLAKYYRQFSLVPVTARNQERWHIKEGQ